MQMPKASLLLSALYLTSGMAVDTSSHFRGANIRSLIVFVRRGCINITFSIPLQMDVFFKGIPRLPIFCFNTAMVTLPSGWILAALPTMSMDSAQIQALVLTLKISMLLLPTTPSKRYKKIANVHNTVGMELLMLL
jgi:hypothetical protein